MVHTEALQRGNKRGMKMLDVRGKLLATFILILMIFSVPSLYAQQLPDSDWLAYLGGENAEPKEFLVSTVPLFGPSEFMQRVKPKGMVDLEGRTYRKSVILHDSGPLANQVIETFIRVSADGLYERKKDGSEILLAPRPLVVGQTWLNGTDQYKFEGIEDFETFKATVSDCLKFTVIQQEPTLSGQTQQVTGIRYYERGKGLIYKNVGGEMPVTRILSQYASKAEPKATIP